MIRYVLCCLVLIPPVLARDFGTEGHVYTIAEPDLLQQILSKLKTLEAEGRLQYHTQQLHQKAREGIRRPRPLKLTKATKSRVFFYDPSLRLTRDLRDHKGRLFQKAGTNFNPLAQRALSKPLIFADGDDKAQRTWLQRQQGKIILTAGSPFELMATWQCPVYFDQGGILTRKLGIKHVPAIVTQEGLRLKITEHALEAAA